MNDGNRNTVSTVVLSSYTTTGRDTITRDYLTDPLVVLSFGGGVQSTAMLLLISEGKLPKPDYVVFSDTGSEMPETYSHIQNRVIPFCEKHELEFLIVKKDGKPLHEFYGDRNMIPNIANRQCTSKFKIRPINKWARSIVGSRRGKVLLHVWLGITTDERHRAKPSQTQWTENQYPLLELQISRDECVTINRTHGWEDTIKSGCWCCPFHTLRSWRELHIKHPHLLKIAASLENNMFAQRPERNYGFLKQGKLSDIFNNTHTLLDFDPTFLDEVADTCSEGGGCFL